MSRFKNQTEKLVQDMINDYRISVEDMLVDMFPSKTIQGLTVLYINKSYHYSINGNNATREEAKSYLNKIKTRVADIL